MSTAKMRIMLKIFIAVVSTGLLLTSAVQAEDKDSEKSCDGSTYEMVECLKAKTAQWDKRMNLAYQRELKNAESPQRAQLRAAQRLWILYREANCLYYSMGEGTIAGVDAGECMRRMTEARARELEGVGGQ
jgi:uncharacterized protein YecT (DUF1311 family)